MKKLRVLLDYSKLSDYELSTLAGKVLQFMTANGHFTTPEPSLTDYETAVTDFNQKLEVADKGGSTLEKRLKRESREVLLDLMRRLAFYVNTVGNNVGSVLESSGFRMIAPDRNVGIAATPERVRLADWHQRGNMKLDFDRVPDADSYEFQVSGEIDENGNRVWGEVQYTSRTRNNVVGSVIPAMLYFVRVRSRNRHGVSDWSELVSWIAR